MNDINFRTISLQLIEDKRHWTKCSAWKWKAHWDQLCRGLRKSKRVDLSPFPRSRCRSSGTFSATWTPVSKFPVHLAPRKNDFKIILNADCSPFPDTCVHFVCLVRHLDTVIATPGAQAEPGDSCLRFPSTLKLQDLYSDFKVTIEVYSLQTRAEILPHEVKYHIHSSGSGCSSSNSKKVWIFVNCYESVAPRQN